MPKQKSNKIYLKLIFFILAAILIYFTFIIVQQINCYSHEQDLTIEAAQNEDYAKVASIQGAIFDGTPLVNDKEEKLTSVVFAGTHAKAATYYVEGKAKTQYYFSKSYYFYLFNPKFSYSTITVGGKKANNTALRFETVNGETYDYLFEISNEINQGLYINDKDITTVKDSILYGGRTIVSSVSTYGFFGASINEEEFDYIKEEAKFTGDINKFSVIDSDGMVIYTKDINLDFSQKFFDDVDETTVKATEFYNNYYSESSKDKRNALANEYEEWREDKIDALFNNNPTYMQAMSSKERYPASCTWGAVGVCALLIVVIFLVYMLVFHFKFLRALIFRENRRVNPGVKQRRDVVTAKVAEPKFRNNFKNENKIEAKKATVKEEAKEEAPEAEEVPSSNNEESNTEVNATVNVEDNNTEDTNNTSDVIDAEFTEVEEKTEE